MVPKKRIKKGSVVKVKTWNELKEVHGADVDEKNPAHDTLCRYLISNAGQKRTVLDIEKSEEYGLKIYIETKREFRGMYLLLKEIASACTEIELDESLFEL